MLTVNLEKLCFIVVKAREFDAKVEPVEPDPGSNPTDSGVQEVLEDYADDPTFEELVGAIEALNVDEQNELLALVWLGRGDYTADEWDSNLKEAARTRDQNFVRYLTGIPLLADLIEDGLSQLGLSCQDFEFGHL